MGMLETKPRSFERAATALNSSALPHVFNDSHIPSMFSGSVKGLLGGIQVADITA